MTHDPHAKGGDDAVAQVDEADPAPTRHSPLLNRQSSLATRHSPLPHWLLEGLFIVVSVALGFAVAEYGDRRDERELAGRVLASLAAEVEHNRSLLAPVVPVHGQWVQALADAKSSSPDQSALDVWFATRPPLPPGTMAPFPLLRRSAWDVAVSGGALRLIDYELASALSEIYRMQEIATDNVDRLAKGPLASVATYDPSARAPSVRLLWLTLADIQAAETMLLDLYDKHLPAIRAAAREQ